MIKKAFFLAVMVLSGTLTANSQEPKIILTPKPGPAPRIHGTKIFGVRPGSPFLFTIPATGKKPLHYELLYSPGGLKCDPVTGQITGIIDKPGEYNTILKVSNEIGSVRRPFKIVCGDKLALTPQMGWNSWYVWENHVTDKIMRDAADAMVNSEMINHGYMYINIDDCWASKPGSDDSTLVAEPRDSKGTINSNKRFPDMKALADYIHSKGLKAGIYTSPGTLTCGGFAGAYQHEEQDARQFAEWGFDFLKYDWCSYGKIAGIDKSLETYQKPYRQMGDILKSLDRDIVFNLCQYGMGDVWKWGDEVGGQCWRTSGDLGFELDRIFDVALKNSEYRQYSKPGAWNDPDYIQIGWIGNASKQGIPELTPMPKDMQYAYMSLWSLMAAPLIYSGDMTKLDEFTLNVLCNPEVIEVNQDPLGESGLVIPLDAQRFIMVKNLEDGSKAVGLFNRGKKAAEVVVDLTSLKLYEKQLIRDIWHQKDLGIFDKEYSAQVPAQGVVMVKISKL